MSNYLQCRVGVYFYTSWKTREGKIKDGYKKVRASTLLECLTSTEGEKLIEQYRQTKERHFKSSILSFTPTGLYGDKRAAKSEPIEKTALVQIDIDAKNNDFITDWADLRDALFYKYNWIAAIGLSCSGTGLFVLVHTTTWEAYEEHFHSIRRFIIEHEEINVDDAVSSPNELRYFTLPGDIVFREDATIYTDKDPLPVSEFQNVAADADGELISFDILNGKKMHYVDMTSYIGVSISNGTPQEAVIKILCDNSTDLFDTTSSAHGNPDLIARTVEDMYVRYASQFKKGRKAKSDKEIQGALPDEYRTWLRKHVFVIPSVMSKSKYAHILCDEHNVCTYYESAGNGKASELLRHHIARIKGVDKWYDFKNEGLDLFNEAWIQRDTETEIYFYYKNGTLRITKDAHEFIAGENRKMIWASLVLDRDYKETSQIHEIADIAQKVFVDYNKFQIGLGYLLHQYNSRNKSKVIWAVDHKPKVRNDGGRGKDLNLTVGQLIRPYVPVKWNPKNSNFWTSNIQPDTAIVHFEDVSNLLSIDDEFKRTVTGDMAVEHKGANIVTRPFSTKPKFSVTSQRYPYGYEEPSIRRRIWLIEVNDTLQKNPPKKTLLYEDKDLSPFDAWIIQVCKYYLTNVDELIGTPEITEDQAYECLRVRYGDNIVEAVVYVKKLFVSTDFVSTDEVAMAIECRTTDAEKIGKFRECYQKMTGSTLQKLRTRRDGNQVSGFVLEIENLRNGHFQPDLQVEVPF